MKLSLVLLAAGLALAATACTDASRASLTAYGEQSTVECWSGGIMIRQDESTGKVEQIDGDGLTYKSAKTGKYVRAYADCIIENK